MRLLSLFSGIGAFEKALDKMGIPYELERFCEFDKYAVRSYCAVHGVDESLNLGDITKISETDLPKSVDMVTYGFPCQDISIAGKQKGLFNEDGTATRSGLFFEALRVIQHCNPKVAIAENVKNLTGKKFSEQFETVLKSLEQAGYNNYWKVLNAKDYGIPQNRERVFIVSIRKDIDNGVFNFQKPMELNLRLRDMLEDDVDEKYYISHAMVKYIENKKDKSYNFRVAVNREDGVLESPIRAAGDKPMIERVGKTRSGGQKSDIISDEGICSSLTATDYKQPKQVALTQVCNIVDDTNIGFKNPQRGRVYSADGLSPALNACGGGGSEPKIIIPEATKKGYAEAEIGDSINLEQPNSKTRRGRVGKGVAQTLTTSPQQAVIESMNYDLPCSTRKSQVAGTIRSSVYKQGKRNLVENITSGRGYEGVITNNLRIRKLTPKECWRLMGFDDEDFEKAESVNSNTQLYKQAGNSIVVNVIVAIFEELKGCVDFMDGESEYVKTATIFDRLKNGLFHRKRAKENLK